MKKYLKETAKYILRSPWRIRQYIDEVERMYAMTPEELAKRNEERFMYIFRRAINESPFYKKFYAEAGISVDDVRSLSDITKLPVLTKEMVKANGKDMIIPGKRMVKNHTSGTTGTPLNVWESWEALFWEQAYFYCYRKRCGYVYGKDVMASLRGNLSKAETSLWIHISKTLYLSSYNLKPEYTRLYHKQLLKRKPKAVEGYPSALYTLACNFEEQGLDVSIPVCFTSSENLLDYQRVKIQKVFHTEVFDHYGTTERTIRLEEAFDHNGYFEDPGYSINEYLEDGEITTSLINADFPMIRYRGNDIIELNGDSGRVVKISGRANVNIYGKDGTAYAAGLTSIVRAVDGISNAQLVQKEVGKLDVNVVLSEEKAEDSDFWEICLLEIKKTLNEKIGLGNMDVAINRIRKENLIYSKTGKFNFIVSKITPPSNHRSCIGGYNLFGTFVKSVKGRSMSFIVGKDGSLYSDSALTFILKDGDTIKYAQFIQQVDGSVDLNVVPMGASVSEYDKKHLLELINEKCGADAFDLRINEITENEIIYSSRGKFLFVIRNTM